MPRLASQTHQLEISFEPDAGEMWKPCPMFRGSTSDDWFLTCHVSALRKGESPHPPHWHQEEEILLLLAGEIDLIVPDCPPERGGDRHRLKPGQFVYYPAEYAHTLETVSEGAANYFMLKWCSHPIRKPPHKEFGVFTAIADTSAADERKLTGFRTRMLFENPTAYLRKLHCHTSILHPGSGYNPHADPYDVVIIVLEGEIVTLGKKLSRHGVVYYAAGEPHGMQNLGDTPARYLVFELHGAPVGFCAGYVLRARSWLARWVAPGHWVRRVRRWSRNHGNR